MELEQELLEQSIDKNITELCDFISDFNIYNFYDFCDFVMYLYKYKNINCKKVISIIYENEQFLSDDLKKALLDLLEK